MIKPDWNHASTYTRLGKNVIEMPIDPSSTPINSVLASSATGPGIYPKENSRSSFILLSDGKSYDAYIMTILADPSYLKNDLSKLAKNTYRKRDTAFTGFVFYFTPKGQYSGGYEFKNGQLLIPTAQNAQSTGKTIQSVSTSNLKTAEDEPPSYDCIFFYDLTLDQNGNITSQTFLYAVCSPSSPPPGGGSPSGTGSPSGSAPPPLLCNPAIGGSGDESVQSLIINVTEPPTGGDGGMPPPTTESCSVTVLEADSVKITFCGGLTSTEQSSIINTVDAFKSENCASSYLYNYYDGQSFSFCISPGNYNVIYNPQTNSFTFSTDDAATPAFADLLEHEFFHAFQNSTYSGGITDYGQNASTGANSAGFVNIEFEQAIFNDIVSGNYAAFANGTQAQKNAYEGWIKGLTADGTVYPKLTPGTSAYTTFISNYNSFLNQYNALPNNPNTSPVISLTPQAFINLFNNVSPTC